MQFYIFAGNKKDMKCNTKDALYCSQNLAFISEVFESYYNSSEFRSKYKYGYLVADFELQKTNSLKYIKPDLFKDKLLPFLVLQKYEFEKEPLIENISDTITLRTEGFDHEFNNNLLAVDRFIQYMAMFKYCDMIMRFKTFDSSNKLKEGEIKIANTMEIIKQTEFYPIKKFFISTDWLPNPIDI